MVNRLLINLLHSNDINIRACSCGKHFRTLGRETSPGIWESPELMQVKTALSSIGGQVEVRPIHGGPWAGSLLITVVAPAPRFQPTFPSAPLTSLSPDISSKIFFDGMNDHEIDSLLAGDDVVSILAGEWRENAP
jgi:hypothetical protein